MDCSRDVGQQSGSWVKLDRLDSTYDSDFVGYDTVCSGMLYQRFEGHTAFIFRVDML
jgi:hypothetical protein